MMPGKKRPFRVWSCDRKLKKAVVVTSFKELVDKSKEKLGYKEEDVKVVLEHDGTLVEDEEYFAFVEDNTTLMVLCDGEKWESIKGLPGVDETDLTSDGQRSRIEELALLLRQDLAKLVTMSMEDLQVLVDADSEELCHLLGSSLSDVESIQTGCQRVLDDRSQATEAKQLLRLLKNKVSDQQHSAENCDKKRQRLG